MVTPDFGQHLLGVRIDDVKHLCPSCSIVLVIPTCRWCDGSGMVDEEMLARFSAWWNDRVRRGEPVA